MTLKCTKKGKRNLEVYNTQTHIQFNLYSHPLLRSSSRFLLLFSLLFTCLLALSLSEATYIISYASLQENKIRCWEEPGMEIKYIFIFSQPLQKNSDRGKVREKEKRTKEK